MYQFTTIKSDLTKDQLFKIADTFEKLETTGDLARLIKKPLPELIQQSREPVYQQFHIPKPGGQKRFIQNPNPALKAIQSQLNHYLQAVYFRLKPACAHGFVLSAKEEGNPRNIYTNAMTHNSGHWFLNIDLKDFFHTVTDKMVYTWFYTIFGFEEELSEMLTKLCTFQGRLPMGAPTSPVLSNLVCYFLDHQFLQMAKENRGKYSRFADDLTFSFPERPEDGLIEFIRKILEEKGFVINDKKVRLQERMSQPEITGLVIGKGNKPALSKAWLNTLKKEIRIYRWLITETVQRRALFQNWLFEQFRKSLEGQVEFAGFVLGKNDRTYQKLAGKLKWG